MDAKEHIKAYNIPENFIEGGRIFNGMFKTRNFIEGMILGGACGLLAYLIPIEEVSTRVAVVLSAFLPGFLLAVVGINEDPLSVFLKSVFAWRKNKKIMRYNDTPQASDLKPVDIMMSEPLPKDKIIEAYENWSNKKKKEDQARFENVIFEFEEDEELRRLREQKQRIETRKRNAEAAQEKTENDGADEDAFSVKTSDNVYMDLDEYF